ncbi:MAG: hypothetical protein RL153_594, partial [Verrucomicrobiota bacterium]
MHPSPTFSPLSHPCRRCRRLPWRTFAATIAAALCGLTSASRAGIDNPEVEPNDLKSSAFLAASGGGG